jgi:tetratricopeptide (TPR) repeat protein
MEKILNQLSIGEFVLLVLGIILFFTLLIILIIMAVQKREFKVLLFFFLIPLAMIGWPTIKSMKLSPTGFELSNENINKAQTNQEARSQLEQITKNLNGTNISSPDSIKLLAKANAVLGDTNIAIQQVERVLMKYPNDKEALHLRNIYSTPDVILQKSIDKVKTNPTDPNAKAELQSNLQQIETGTETKKPNLIKVAAAHYLLADTAKTISTLEKAVVKDPELKNVTNARHEMMKEYVATPKK